jgi:hypothetical protein
MHKFLRQLGLKDQSIKMYLGMLEGNFFTRNELLNLDRSIDDQEFTIILNELLSQRLILRIDPKDIKIAPRYHAIPPFGAILAYYENIKTNNDSISIQVQDLISKSLKDLFSHNDLIELNSITDATQLLKKDIEEETLIQKQEIDDIASGMENLTYMNKVLDDLYQVIKGLTQNQFSQLIKYVSKTETDIKVRIEELDLKKSKDQINKIIEESFKTNFSILVSDFTVNLHKMIEDEFNKTRESVKTIIQSTFQFRDDFKMLLVNILNNFELKLNKVLESIKEKNELLTPQMEEFRKLVIEKIGDIIINSINSIIDLNNPIHVVMEDSLNLASKARVKSLNNLWQIKTQSNIYEEITNVLTHSKREVILIVPKLDVFLPIEMHSQINSQIHLKIASSEAHTNSLVKTLMEFKNLEYRALKNEGVIIIKSDANYVIMGVIESNPDLPSQDFNGFGTTDTNFITLVSSFISSFWDLASPDSIQAPRSIGVELKDVEFHKETIHYEQEKLSKPSISLNEQVKKELDFTSTHIPSDANVSHEKNKKDSQLIKKLEEKQAMDTANKPVISKEEVLEKKMATADKSSIEINTALDLLIHKMNSLTGAKFAEELETIAELILERKGFSVTLHKIRMTINQYKVSTNPLNELDMKQIIESIDDWKMHLL